MQSTVGHWIAIFVLGALAAYGIGMYFNQQMGVEQLNAKFDSATARELAQDGNKSVADLMVLKGDLEETIKKLNDEIAGHKKTISDKEDEITRYQAEAKTARSGQETAQSAVKDAKEQAVAIEAKFKETITALEQKSSDAKAEYVRQIADLQDQLQKKERDNSVLSSTSETMTKSAIDRIQALQQEKRVLRDAINQKTESIRHRTATKSADVDGKIIKTEPKAKFCVINLGRVNNIHRGMRFDVVRWRLNKWDKVATIEVTKVDTSTSQAAILDMPAVKKVCPVTGYVAKDPEEEFSPYASTDDDKVVHLVKVAQENISTMDESDPVQAGDSIVNPFYDKDKVIKFVLAGERVEVAADVLANEIRKSGGTVQPDVDVETDFLVIGKIPVADPNAADTDSKSADYERYQKTMDIAKQYGIPIIREVELYDFLRN